MGKFQSSKVFDGFSTVFRQWKATDTHCRFVHAYGISFKVYFEGDLDDTTLTSLELTKRIQNKFNLDKDWPGMRFEFGGEGNETAKSVENLNKSFLGALAGIFLILIFNPNETV